jgi:ABC-type amino acid transport substrate-binding protein
MIKYSLKLNYVQREDAKMKKLRLMILILLGSMLLSQGLLAQETVDSKEVLTVVHSSSYYPYSYFDQDGVPTGLLIDFWKLWAKENKVEIKIELYDWNQALQLVKDGKKDIVGGAFYTEDRAPYFDFSEPVMKVQTGLFVDNALGLKNVKALEKHNVGVIKGDYAEEYLKKNYAYLTIVTYDNIEDIFAAVKDDGLKAFTMDFNDITLAAIYLRFGFIKEYKLLETIIASEYRGAVKKGRKDLIDLINKGIGQI